MNESTQWRIRLFGPLHIEEDGTEIRNPGGRARSLLAYLLIYSDRAHTREQVMDALWPELDPDRARRSLSDSLYRLRETPAGTLVLSEGEELAIAPQAYLWVDLWEFTRAALLDAPADLDRALSLAVAPILPEIYDDWILARRAAVQEQRATLLRKRALLAEQQSDLHLAHALYQQMVEDDSLDEDAWRGHIRTLARMGHLRDALDVYQRLEQVLNDELGAPPESETSQLVAQIRREFDAQRAKGAELPRFTGRTRERSQLVAALDRTAERHGGLQVLLAENGMGRTSLMQEMERSARWRGVQVVWGRGDGALHPAPFAPLPQALQAALPEVRMQQLGEMVRKEWLFAIQRLIVDRRETDGERSPSSRLTTGAANLDVAPIRDIHELGFAVASTLRALGEIVPLLVLLDDMQWADRSLWDLLDAMRHVLVQSRVLIVVSSRLAEVQNENAVRDRIAAWDQEGLVPIHTLMALSQDEIGEILAHHHLLPDEEAALAEIHRDSGGNPMHAIILATLAMSHATPDAMTTGDGRGAGSFAQEFLLRKFRALPADQRSALEECAILGAHFSWQLWAAFRQAIEREEREQTAHIGKTLAGAPTDGAHVGSSLYPAFLLERGIPDATAAQLPFLAGQLEQQEFLALDSANYRFPNILLQQAIHDQIRPERRLKLHRQAFAAAELLPDAPLGSCLRHAQLAELRDQTFQYALLMGRRALANSSLYSAREYLALALANAPEGASANEDTVRLAELYRARARVLGLLGMREEQHADLVQLTRLADELQDDVRRFEAANLMANHLYSIGKLDEALVVAESALEGAMRAMLDVEVAAMHETIARIERERKQIDRAIQHVEEAHNRHMALGNQRGLADTADLRAGLAYDVGDYLRAAQGHLDAANLFVELGDILGEAKALNNLGTIYWELGDYAGARATHERTILVCRAAGDLLGEGDNIDNLGGVYWSLGEYDEAIRHYSAALQMRRSMRDEWGIGISLGNLGSALLRQGNPQEALAYYNEAWPLYRKNGRRRSEGYVLYNIGCARLELGDVKSAIAALAEALAIREEIGDLAKVIESYAGLALAQLAAEEDEAAIVSVNRAIALLQAGEYPHVLRQEVYCAAWQIADLLGNKQTAREYLGKAELAMYSLCETIPPEAMETFLANVPVNRQVASALREYALTVDVQCAPIGSTRGRALRPDELRNVRWTLSTPGDEQIVDPTARRQRALRRLLRESSRQAVVPTDEQLAGALGVSRRTILRDREALGAASTPLRAPSHNA